MNEFDQLCANHAIGQDTRAMKAMLAKKLSARTITKLRSLSSLSCGFVARLSLTTRALQLRVFRLVQRDPGAIRHHLAGGVSPIAMISSLHLPGLAEELAAEVNYRKAS